MKYVVLIGPPASGEGTMSKKLSETLKLSHVSTGQMLRDEIQKSSTIGLAVQDLISKGNFASDDMITTMLGNLLDAEDYDDGAILDGFPRTMFQLGWFEAYVASQYDESGIIPDVEVFHLYAPDDVLLQRILERGKKHGRPDDTQEAFPERMERYRSSTSPIIEFYKGKGQLHEIDAGQALNLVEIQIKSFLQIK
jgi:adenylate kinase